jgi:hypothetical protein
LRVGPSTAQACRGRRRAASHTSAKAITDPNTRRSLRLDLGYSFESRASVKQQFATLPQYSTLLVLAGEHRRLRSNAVVRAAIERVSWFR